MNLIEAIKSGKPFKRKGHTAWHDLTAGGYVCWLGDQGKSAVVHMHAADVTADDWELKEPAVTITRAQFWQAAQVVDGNCQALREMARRLGLETA